MILVCPSCSSTHHIARGALGDSGRSVRCGQCRTTWFEATAFPAETEHELAVEASSARVDDWTFDHQPANENDSPTWNVRHRRRRVVGWLRHVAVFALAGAAPMAAVAHREAVVDLFPATAALYAAIGLPVNLRGFELRTVKSTLVAGDRGESVLAIAGEVTNLRPVVQGAPPVRVALRARDGREIYTWTTALAKIKLKAHETIAFRTRLADPPSEAHEVVVQFAEAAAPEALASRSPTPQSLTPQSPAPQSLAPHVAGKDPR